MTLSRRLLRIYGVSKNKLMSQIHETTAPNTCSETDPTKKIELTKRLKQKKKKSKSKTSEQNTTH